MLDSLANHGSQSHSRNDYLANPYPEPGATTTAFPLLSPCWLSFASGLWQHTSKHRRFFNIFYLFFNSITSLALLTRDVKIRLTGRDEKDGTRARGPKR